MADKTVHMIGQAHLDPVWLWTWSEGRAEALATSQSALDRLDEYPAFQFTRGEAQVYRWIEQEDPALFARIREMIRQGRWHVVNGMVIQPDMNLPQGESFVRQFLLGKGYMREHLEVEPTIAYCVDSFGHNAMLPQIFRKSGCEAYIFMRPGPHEMELPAQAFWWQAPDGSRVLAFRIAGAYTTRRADQEAHVDRALQAAPAALADTMCFFGVGDHGGGPTRAQIENIQEIAAQRAAQQEIRFSSPAAYFSRVSPQAVDLPVVQSELYYHAVGCYAANSALKRAHRKAECALLSAERLAALAQVLTGAAAPAQRLHELWWTLCFNQFHDILGGCTVKPAADEAVRALNAVLYGAREIANSAGRAAAAKINTLAPDGSKDGGSVIVFNPSGQALDGYVEYEPWTGWDPWLENHWGLVDEQGRAVEHQLVNTDEALSKTDGAMGICRLVWRAQVPALGYRLYRFAPGLGGAWQAPNNASVLKVSSTSLENEHLRLELDPHSGEITSCRLLAEGIELVGPEGWNAALVLEDTTDTWSHAVTSFGPVIGKFGDARLRVGEEGPLQVSVVVERSFAGQDGSRGSWEQWLVLRRGEAELQVRNWLSWQGHFKAVKLAFDLAAQDIQAVHHTAFGWTRRPTDGSERAAQLWVDLSGSASAETGQTVGLAVLNEGKYSCDVSGSTFRQTVLRCPPYAYHNPPHTFGSKPRYDWLDQGLQEFTLVLRPHVGEWQGAGVARRALELNFPPELITQHAHPGDLSPCAGLAELDTDQVELTALKTSEDGAALILRLVERCGRAAQAVLHWRGQACALAFGPFEIKTLRLNEVSGAWQIAEADLLEKPVK